MKTIIVTMSFIMQGLTAAFADGTPKVNNTIQQSLNREFTGCQSVTWIKVKDYQQATFVFHESLVVAYFNEDGDLLGSARNITVEKLPLSVLQAFDKRLAGFEISEILEIANTEGTSYMLTLDKGNKSYHAKANTAGEIIRIIAIKQKSQP
jgi:hypothetical protein